jgi:hypothetical protein
LGSFFFLTVPGNPKDAFDAAWVADGDPDVGFFVEDAANGIDGRGMIAFHHQVDVTHYRAVQLTSKPLFTVLGDG